jgi:hypothetical protein
VRFAAVLIAGMGIGVAGASSAWLARSRAPAPPRAPRQDRLDVGAGATARLHRAGRWRLALAGPGTVTAGDGEDAAVQVSGGTLTIAAEGAPVAIEAGTARFRLAPGAAAQIEISAGGAGQALALAGKVDAATPSAAMRSATGEAGVLALRALDGDLTPAPAAAPPEVAAPPEPIAPPAVLAPPAASVAPARVPVRRAAIVPPPPAATPATEALDDAPAASPAPVPADVADSEAKSLSQALARLRRDRDPASALALLDEHEARFPAGAMRAEAVALRIEALLARHDQAAALAALDALPVPGVPLDRRLRASRGELRAQAGRCIDAFADLSQVLHATPRDAVDERALRSRAACAAYDGDEVALEADLQLYLQYFGDRPFADEARARLAKQRPAP